MLFVKLLFSAAAAAAFVPLPVFAHGATGEYAGTHVVALEAEPRSPFVGETVKMTFYLRDLRRMIEENPFVISVEIQKDLSGGEEVIFSSEPETIMGGIYELDYAFPGAGPYHVQYNFWPPDNPDVKREAIFDIEAREAPPFSFLSPLSSLLFLLVTSLAALFAGVVIGVKLKNRYVR